MEVGSPDINSSSYCHFLSWNVLQISLSLPSSEKSNYASKESKEKDQNEEG